MDIIIRIALFIFAVAAGAQAAHKNWVHPKTAQHLLWLIFWVGLPVTIVGAILSVEITPDQLILPLIAFGIALVNMVAGFLAAYLLNIPKKIAGVLICGSMIMNTNFTISFIGAWFGQPGVALFSLFDMGNILSLFLIAYPIALVYGGSHISPTQIVTKVLSVPTVWAIFIALALNIGGGILLPDYGKLAMRFISLGIFTLVMFTLGLLIKQGMYKSKLVGLGLFLRYGVGGLIGWWVTSILGIDGALRAIIIVAAASPNGYTTLIYARMAKLDQKFAASLVSTSLLVGLFVTPLLLLLLT